MKKITKAKFEQAQTFMQTQAQDIDRAMWEFYFENKAASDVEQILARYQKADGGIGGLDYDFEYTGSCLKSTESACRYLSALQLPPDSLLIRRLISYMIRHYNAKTGGWNWLMVPEVNDYPHAPWWGYNIEEHMGTGAVKFNTHAALAGFALRYPSLVAEDILTEIQNAVLERLRNGGEVSEYDMLSLVFFINGLRDEGLRRELLERLYGNGRLMKVFDAEEKWGTESAYKLCHFIDSPTHVFFDEYRENVEQNLDFLVGAQMEDGSWKPSWRWGEDDIWTRVQKRLQGQLTYRFMKTLKDFGRVE